MQAHAGWDHVLTNLALQCFFGLYLEVINGPKRVMVRRLRISSFGDSEKDTSASKMVLGFSQVLGFFLQRPSTVYVSGK